MGGIDIAMSREIKLLGVTIDDRLTFNTHVANVCRKATGIYKLLSRAARVSWGLNPDIVRIIYTATIEPIILYAASVWAPAAKKLMTIKQLQVVQQCVRRPHCTRPRGECPLELGDREIERVAPAIEAPHPAERISLRLVSLVDREQLNQNSDFEIRIFTDGSRIEGKVGAALSVWNSETEIKAFKLALPGYCTVYQAELLAICKATHVILGHPASSFGVYSDSMAALQTVINHSCLHPLAVESRDKLTTASLQGKVVTLFWIKAHAGMEGNERADQLAQKCRFGLQKKT
uniref:ribonuclease H n=1 Tax=Bombyx mori TaxID=7091 RepID=A0A8R2M994_BOMMO|nr:uncharacterized protein LOC119631103 [Bombyx mori]